MSLQRFALLLVTLTLLLSATSAAQSAPTSYYVATSGSDTAPGTQQQPFRTIQHAAIVARAGDTVVVRTGIYRETVIPTASGTSDSPITFQAAQDEQVVVSGADLVPSDGWVKDGEQWYAPWPGDYVSANNQSDQVFVDGKPVNLARWPQEKNNNLSFPAQASIDSIVSSSDTGKKTPGPQYPIFRVTFSDAEWDQLDGRWDGAKVWINTGGATDEQDGNGQSGIVIGTSLARKEITVEIDASAAQGSETPKNFQLGKGSSYYLFDPPSVAGLLYNGEFWHDRQEARLYLHSPDGTPPSGHRVEVKRRDYAFNLDGKSSIVVKGFGIFAASITTDAEAGDGKGNGGLRTDIAPSSNIVLDGLRASYVTHFVDQTGHIQTQWSQASGIILSGTGHTIKNSEIAWSAGNGLVVIGKGHTVTNNLIHDTNYTAAEGGGINLGRTTDVTSLDHDVGYNTVYNSGLEGIEFSALQNSSGLKSAIAARIHHNVVFNTVLQSADSGGIKAFGSDGGWARIDHNVIYNIGGPDVAQKYVYFGIYLDFPKEKGEYVIDHNVVYNTPTSLNINGMKNLDIFNNTLIARGEVARAPVTANGTLENVVIRNTISNRALRIPTTGVTLSNNILPTGDSQNTEEMLLPWFVDGANQDMAQRDYSLTAAATEAIDKGADVAPFNDATPPDIGAYEFGKERGHAGAVIMPSPPVNPCASQTTGTTVSPQQSGSVPFRVLLPVVVTSGREVCQ